MARIPGVPREKAGPMVKLVYIFMGKGMKKMTGRAPARGSGIEPVEIWAYQPKMLSGMGKFQQAVRKGHSVDERLRRVDGRNAFDANTLDQLPRQRARPAADIDHPLPQAHTSKVSQLWGQRDRVPAHKAVVGIGLDGEAHPSRLFVSQGPAAPVAEHNSLRVSGLCRFLEPSNRCGDRRGAVCGGRNLGVWRRRRVGPYVGRTASPVRSRSRRGSKPHAAGRLPGLGLPEGRRRRIVAIQEPSLCKPRGPRLASADVFGGKLVMLRTP